MLVFANQGLVLLEVPKTGSSALVSALAARASVAISQPAGMRHMSAMGFARTTLPWLRDAFGLERVETFAVMREPVERMASWYRFLHRDEIARPERSVAGLGFGAFLDRALDPGEQVLKVGNQARFLMGQGDTLLVDHLFSFDRPDLLAAFLKDRLNAEVDLSTRVNASPAEVAVEITQPLRDVYAEARPREMRLWQALARTGQLAGGPIS